MRTRPSAGLFGTILLLLATLLLSACGEQQRSRFDPLPADAVVLVIGDSLVAGTGASTGKDWPRHLAEATGWKVVNAGVPGNTSADARRRLPELLDIHYPQAVIIAIGGNDFLRDVSPDETRDNIAAMIRHTRDVTEHVALVAIPAKSMSGALFGSLSDHALYVELATENELALIPNAVSAVLSDAALRSDRIHANNAGYAHIAQRVFDSLREYGWFAH